MLDFHTIIFLGPQGSGKGTQAQLLCHRINAEHIEMGALIRKVARQDTDFGKHIKQQHDNGFLISDNELIQIIDDKLKSLQPEKKVIFDGVPRKIVQAEYLVNYLKTHGRHQIITIYITIPREETLRRLSKRLICSVCEEPAILSGDPAQVCTECGGALIHRPDDNPEAINRRLDLYEKETLPVVDYLRHNTRLFEIDGMGQIQGIEQQIDNVLGIKVNA